MRRPLLIVFATALIAAGVAVAVVPFDASITFVAAARGTVHGTSNCGTPVRAAFRSSGESSAWFAYAPGTKVIASDGFGCQGPARRRVAFGAVLGVVGGIALVFAFRVQRRELEEATAS